MNKLTYALAAGLAVTACSSHTNAPVVPTSANQPNDISQSLASTNAAPSGWAATHTLAFNVVRGATDLGALAPNTPITVRVGLAMRNASSLQNEIAHNVAIDDGAFMATYAPTSAAVTAVTTYLTQKGFHNIVVEPNHLLISADGTSAQAQAAFNTTLHSFSWNGNTYRANTAPAYVPSSLGGTVVAVLGLNNAQTVRTTPKVTACEAGVTNPCVRFYDPATFRKAYDTGTATALNTTVGVMAEGNVTQAVSDFRYNEDKFGLPRATLTIKPVGIPSTDTAGNDEWTLDMTYSTGIAGIVKGLYLYDTTSLTDSDIALEYSHWVTDDLAKVGNSSFGECELFPYVDGAMLVDDMLFMEGAAHGQTMFASTGDTGGFCSVGVPPNGVPGGAPLVEYPAASPYVVAVGGTDLFTASTGAYQGENAWEAGGGGYSQFEYSPYWEAYAQPVAAQGQNFRGSPDVAMDASLETGALIYLGGTEDIIGGTSLASPLAVGSYAIFQTHHSNVLGFAPPRLYTIYKENPSGSGPFTGPPPTEMVGGLHDIIAGTNGNPACTAIPRWDCATGLGSFDILKTNAVIGK